MSAGKTLLNILGFGGVALGVVTLLLQVHSAPIEGGAYNLLFVWLIVGPITWIPGSVLVIAANLVKGKGRRVVLVAVATGLVIFGYLGISLFVFAPVPDFTVSANLQVVAATCTHGPGGNAGGSGYCLVDVADTGSLAGSIVGCTIDGEQGISGAAIPPVVQKTVSVPSYPSDGSQASVYCAGGEITTGTTVYGSLVVASGPPLAFSAIAS
jgi:hypothetical protein